MPIEPGWVVASIVTGVMIAGKGVAGAIVCDVPGMLKTILLAPAVVALESVIAWRNDPEPMSRVLVTANVVSKTRRSAASTPGL